MYSCKIKFVNRKLKLKENESDQILQTSNKTCHIAQTAGNTRGKSIEFKKEILRGWRKSSMARSIYLVVLHQTQA